MEISDMRAECEKITRSKGTDDFTLLFNGTNFRGSVIRSIDEVVYVLRRFPSKVPDLNSLSIPPMIVKNLLEPEIAGLFVIAGAFGQGKTTTCSSVMASRLSVLGGVGVTIENPPEMRLQGRHGEGVCYQTWVEQGEFASALRKATRWAPSIIMIGEIRDAETAIEALRASVNGRLVICTTHADSVSLAIERIYALATSVTSSADTADLMASSLSCVIHQRLEKHGNSKRLMVESLWVPGAEEMQIREMVRSRKLSQLSSVIQHQKQKMLVGGAR